MIFYRIVAAKKFEDTAINEEQMSRRERLARANQVRLDTETYNQSLKSGVLFVSDMTETKTYVGGLFIRPVLKREYSGFLSKLGISYDNISIEEITWDSIHSLLSTASRNDFIENEDELLRRFRLDPLRHCRYDEELIPEPDSRAALKKRADAMLTSSLSDELERILTGPKRPSVTGHPVQYIIETNDDEVFHEMKEVLLMSLLRVGRLKGRRCTDLDRNDMNTEIEEVLYRAAEGGTVCADFQADLEDDSEFANAAMEDIKATAKLLKRYRNQVLTILRFPKSCTKLKDFLFGEAGSCTFVELTEDTVFGDTAREYLAAKAEQHHAIPDGSLSEMVEDDDTGYSPTDLNRLFDQWLDSHMKTVVYPQYSAMQSARMSVQKQVVKGSAYAEMQKMIGLAEAKKVIGEALSYYKAQKLFAEKGMQADHPAMHMVFTGNPGTAKTTVARLFAQIMKDNGLLSEGDLYEVGRADLVGKYVGWTARIVKEKFRQAKGSVLFIDEAYSLLDDREGMFGDEAINTIVQEMENNREDMVVIFAGYPKEMEQFLARNPGLRSRIAYHIPFEDYSAGELYEIARLTAEKKGLKLAQDTQSKLMPVFESVVGQEDFGNGRYVRSLLEKARMKQAARLVELPFDEVTREDIATLRAEDFDIAVEEKKAKVKMGFGM